MSEKHYDIRPLIARGCDYSIVFGERSNGKTYSALEYALEQYISKGRELAYVRRWKEDVIGKRASSLWEPLVTNGVVTKLTNGEYDRIKYYNGRWYLANFDEKLNKTVTAPDAFAYAFALSDVEHDKSTAWPGIKTIVFDEFLTRRMYLPDEFVIYMNVLSTIIRNKTDVKIIMLGNTVNKYCPYFTEMGLRHVPEMKQGTVDTYHYGNGSLSVAVEYAKTTNKRKKANKYFAFDNPNLDMIKSGAWELAIYPHLSVRYTRQDVLFVYFVISEGQILQCEIIQLDNNLFTYVHRKTTPIRKPDKEIIYTVDSREGMNYRHRLLFAGNKLQGKIGSFYANDKVFYQDNEVGELMREFIRKSETSIYSK